MSGTPKGPRIWWKSLSLLDWAAVGVCAAALWSHIPGNPLTAMPGVGFLRYLGVLAAAFLLYRFWTRWRGQLLWSLRNRLVVAYQFIALVPIILILVLSGLLAQIIYSQLAAYLLYHDIQDRLEMLSDTAENIVAAETMWPAGADPKAIEKAMTAQAQIAEGKNLPGL